MQLLEKRAASSIQKFPTNLVHDLTHVRNTLDFVSN